MAANWSSLILLIFVVWFVHKLMAAHSDEENEAQAEVGARSEKTAEATAATQSAEATQLGLTASANSLSAQMNKDPSVVVPFRGPENLEAADRQNPAKEAPQARQKKSAKPKKRWWKARESTLKPMPAVYSEKTDWSMYEAPTVLRHHPDWMPPEWIPEKSDQEIAEMVPERDHSNVIAIQDLNAYFKDQATLDSTVLADGFFWDQKKSKVVPLGAEQFQMELPLRRH